MFIFYWYISHYCWSLEFKELHQVLWWHWACRNGWVNPFWPIRRLQTKIGGCHLVFLLFLLYRSEGWTASLVEYVTTSEFSPHVKLPSIFPIRESLVFDLPTDSDQWMNRLLLMHVLLYRLSICGRIPYNKVLDWYLAHRISKTKESSSQKYSGPAPIALYSQVQGYS